MRLPGVASRPRGRGETPAWDPQRLHVGGSGAVQDVLIVSAGRPGPFRPQTNGKAEAFIKTLQREWAYRRPYTSNPERLEALHAFLVDYNFARPHTAIRNQPPASRL